MRICLVNPPSPFLLDDRVFPPLGLLQVAAVLEEHGHDVRVVDLGGVTDHVAEMGRNLDGWDVCGITATTPQFPMTTDLLRVIREGAPGVRVILGGPHATVMPESCSAFDCVVMGDGEEAILDAIRPDGPRMIDRASTTTKGELRWHWPARHLIDMESYRYSIGGLKGTSIMMSQGCPYNCSFCCGRLVPYYRRVRVRATSDVVREMEHLIADYGMRAAMAFDDEVNLLNEPLLELCKKIAPLGMKLRGFVKANLFTDQQAEAMAHAGFTDVCTGVEAGDDRILGIIDKKTTREINKQFVDLARKHGMRSKAFCSLGHPGETEESAQRLKEWLLWARPDDFDVTGITVYPGTPLWAKRERVGTTRDGTIVCRYVKHSQQPDEDGATLFFEEIDYSKEFAFYKGKPKAYISHVWTPDLSKDDLVRLRDGIEDSVRQGLGIPYPQRYSGDQFEHSMGLGVADSRHEVR